MLPQNEGIQAMSAKNTRRPRRVPTAPSHPFERLEPRACMAGDVALLLDGNVLTILGDAAGNRIRVEQVAPQSFLVTGLEGTTVNGEAFDTVAFNGKDLRIDLKGGDDHLELFGSVGQPLTVQKLKVDLGAGGDTAALNRLEIQGTSPVDVTLGKGTQNEPDSISISDVRANGSVSLITGGGDDIVRVDAGQFKLGLKVAVEGGNDDLQLTHINVLQDFQLVAADGDDTIEIASVNVSRDLRIDAGKGTDTLSVGDNTILDFITVRRNATLFGGDGDDTIRVTGGFLEAFRIVDGNFTIDAGKGNDHVTVGGEDGPVEMAGIFSVDGGVGDDILLLEELEAGAIMIDFRGGRSDLRANDVVVAGKATLKGGDSSNSIALNRVVAAEIDIQYGKGTTHADLTGVTAAAFAIKTGNAADIVGIRQSGLGRIFAQLGGGDDVLTADQVASNTAVIDAGNGNDRSTLARVFVSVKGNLAGDLTIRGKDGDDRITLDVVAAASTLLDGGNANDTLDETNVLFNARVVQGMEVLV